MIIDIGLAGKSWLRSFGQRAHASSATSHQPPAVASDWRL